MEKIDPLSITTDSLHETWSTQAADLRQQLALLTEKLESLEQSAEQPQRARMKIASCWSEWWSDAYIGGFGPSERFAPSSYEVITDNITLAYLAVLAKQSHSIPDPHYELRVTEDHLTMYIETIQLPGGEVTKAPKEIHQHFSKMREYTAELVAQLRIKALSENPYRGIPVAAGNKFIEDILLRKALLDYCREQDPDFYITDAVSTSYRAEDV